MVHEMKISSTNDDYEQHQQRLNIPKSPSFHSGLDLVAGSGTGNKFANKFNFSSTDMNGNANKSTNAAEQQSSQQNIFSFTKV
jgi:hypothetical protein